MDGWFGWTLYGAGWAVGWLLLWRTRPLPVPTDGRLAVAVVVPARDEARALPIVLPPLVHQLRDGDELVVVDDHSSDGTADVAAACGAAVVAAPDLPAGWVGKPHACWHGAAATTAPVLAFVDADVRPGPHMLDELAAEIARRPGAIVSVQPWHDAPRPIERASLLCNVVALMGSAAFTVFGRVVRPDVAFGPVLAIERDVYVATGGHAHLAARASRTEDIVLARLVGDVELFTGSPTSTTFRMYPAGLRQLVSGWSRTMADGLSATRWWIALAVAAWVWSLAGGLVAAAMAGWASLVAVYVLSAAQVWVLGRRAGRFGPATAALYPLAVAVLVVVIASALMSSLTRRPADWRGRTVP